MSDEDDLIPVPLDDALRKIFGLQFNLQTKIRARAGQCPIAEQTLEQRITAIVGNVFALEHEAHELVDEMKWKDWTAGPPYLNRDAAVKEAIDMLHFLVNIFLHLGATPEEVLTRYVRKNEVNHDRQDAGYDGVSTKCPRCDRALEDVAIREIGIPDEVVYLCVCGQILPTDLAQRFITD